MGEFELTIFTIATNKYFDYFLLQLPDIQEQLADFQKIQYVVATNKRPPGSDSFKDIQIEYVKIQDFTWPEITLLRYDSILQNKDLIKGDNLMWLDTDMKLVKPFHIRSLMGANGNVRFARHPGYVFDLKKFISLNFANMRAAISPWTAPWKRLRWHAGSWETRSESTAYVELAGKVPYVHGAVWLGKTGEVLKMCEVISARIQTDVNSGIIAIWHDESHLNWFFSKNKKNALLPKHFSAWPNGWQYRPEKATFLSLDKNVLDAQILASK